MFISPIKGISAYDSIATIQPMNYAVDNDAELSDVYKTQSTKGTAGINGVTPVQYPDAQVVEVDPLEKVRETQEAGRAFNAVADKFSGATIGYDSARIGYNYGIVGSQFDAFA